ncbi:MAG TPA: tripartite tricarboxylate transporter substrate-binding protein [Xanthobacteraceae bacterium]|nr:tripartite tricarboxylate transporter substrate-binding protein [Xanthobacteraceae bacterium]
MIDRRALLAGVAASAFIPRQSFAAWPERPITMLHGFAPGGGADATARVAADGLSKVLSQPVLVESKPGAGTTLAAGQLVRAAPDGYTIALVTSTYASSAALYKKLPYRPVEDISPIGQLTESPYVIATHEDHPAQTLEKMIEAAKKQSGNLTYGTPGVGSGPHLITELLAQRAGIKLTHVPFRGGAQAVVEVLARRIDFMVDPPLSMIEHIRSGKFRALAVSTAERFPSFPAVPTVAEQGFPGFAAPAWFALAAPAATPAPVLERLSATTADVLADTAVRERLRVLGAEAKTSSPQALMQLIVADIKRWSEVIDRAGIERI